MRQKVFGNVEPKCEYCAVGTITPTGKNVLCPKKGVLAPDFSCKKFKYDPLKRVPKKMPELPKFDAEDFAL